MPSSCSTLLIFQYICNVASSFCLWSVHGGLRGDSVTRILQKHVKSHGDHVTLFISHGKGDTKVLAKDSDNNLFHDPERRFFLQFYYGHFVDQPRPTNSQAFSLCLKKFVEVWNLRHPGQTVWIFGDNLQSHTQIDVIKYAMDRKCELWFLPANSSHFLQPLDAAPFARLKRHMSNGLYEATLKSQLVGTSTQVLFASLAYEAEKAARTPAAIRQGFEVTGLWPWNPTLIQTMARENSGERCSGEEEREALVEATTSVINKFREEATALTKLTTGKKVRAEHTRVFNPAELVQHAEAARILEEMKARAKLESL